MISQLIFYLNSKTIKIHNFCDFFKSKNKFMTIFFEEKTKFEINF